ncbi:MAG: DUF2256 domain-containing protein [Pseudomonadales bacterium]|nr:DUF2256 domain-containing protein [Pseudomonadales bacterium]
MPKTRVRQGTATKLESKMCPVCSLSFNNRKKWQQRGIWPDIVYCSARCRSARKRQETRT